MRVPVSHFMKFTTRIVNLLFTIFIPAVFTVSLMALAGYRLCFIGVFRRWVVLYRGYLTLDNAFCKKR